ncbi:MAG: ATP-dependent DNA helicase RecG [Candidatus Dojkabacteria bacterium]|nr:ATP-dependent DNA helicase RecG [Candidatus Dojkabacteria bacterium]
MLKLSDSIDKIPLIGPQYKTLLARLCINTIQDLLYHFPSYYSDTSQISLITELNTLEKKTILATVTKLKNIRTRYRKFITEAEVEDESGKVDIIWFNQPFLGKILKIGSTFLLNGKLNPNRNKPQLYSPTYELYKGPDTTHLGKLIPQYPVTEGLTNKWFRSRIKYLLSEHTYLIETLPKFIPQEIAKCYALRDKKSAILDIHYPGDKSALKDAREYLAFEELLDIQLKLLKKQNTRRQRRGPKFEIANDKISRFLKSLKFSPTKAQKRVIAEITEDFKETFPSNRLIQGDVGCGKTLVAAAVSIPAIESGYQVAILAPTAILAKQHYETLSDLFERKYKIQLITSETATINNKEIKLSQIFVGTHALLHRKKSLLKKLGLVIVDEQHRFGVKQRETLVSQDGKSVFPHKITMTATPIPRSIALTFFGDLNISIIDEMPAGRNPTKTHLVPHAKRQASYRWLEERIQKEKSQVFWLCPLIEESEKLQTKAVITEYEKLENKIFPNLRIDLLHGRLSEEEKNDKIIRMKQGKTNILVSTSVIEVGMDIPGADIIVIEGAERFGLAQLHQLRGRVGRRANQESWCFLFTSENASPEAVERLKYFAKINDGLKVAEYDLKRRGPGEVYGTKQAGIPDLKIASLTDIRLIKKTREAAEKMIRS